MQTPDSSSSSRGWRILRRFLVAIVALITLVALFYAEEDVRGKMAWHKYEREAAAKGIVLDRHKLEPPPVPDDQNFATTPFLAPVLELNPDPLQPGQSRWRDTNAYAIAGNFGLNFVHAIDSVHRPFGGDGKLVDLNGIAPALNKSSPPPANRAEAAKQVLSFYPPYMAVLEELRTASHRSESRYKINYDEKNPSAILLPHLAILKRLGQIIALRASAELAAGEDDKAFDDLQLLIALGESLRTEPFIISQLVRIAVASMAQQVAWEGLATHKWSDAQLQELQRRFGAMNLLADAHGSLRYEKTAHGTALFDYLREDPKGLAEIDPGEFIVQYLRFAPSGWLYMEQVNYNRLFDEYLLPGFDAQTDAIHLQEITNNLGNLNRILAPNGSGGILQHRVFASILTPAFEKFFQRATAAQTFVNETVIACALERARLATGKYPETLAELTPKFINKIPDDVINGGPLHYHRNADGQFLLYSVGWNEKDDGGKAALNDKGTRLIDQGDWPWPEYPK